MRKPSKSDIRARLSDRADSEYPIFRNMTLHTLVLDGATGRLEGWCCGTAAASGAPPAYTFDLLSFFG